MSRLCNWFKNSVCVHYLPGKLYRKKWAGLLACCFRAKVRMGVGYCFRCRCPSLCMFVCLCCMYVGSECGEVLCEVQLE